MDSRLEDYRKGALEKEIFTYEAVFMLSRTEPEGFRAVLYPNPCKSAALQQ